MTETDLVFRAYCMWMHELPRVAAAAPFCKANTN